ncbi:MAG TPA: Ppx/GppA phosphatase family protein [Thermoanaerobaculia bacterium]|nr:Ppx/GppA phosphatase family protein [Thermoanaerobaculia bacterium]
MAKTPVRIAAIDAGTNSIHMIVVEAQRHGYRIIDREKEMVQLGRDSLEGRPLTDAAIERGVATLKSMAEIARRWKASEVIAVATSAVREAPNRRRFLSAVESAAGIRLRIISGEEESDYIYRAVRSAVDFHGGTALAIDIGGGSVELIVGTSSEVFFTSSEPLGALRMAQRFGLEQAAGETSLDECRRFIRKSSKKTLTRIARLGFDFTVGTSGTIVTLASLARAEGENGGAGVASGLTWLSRVRLGELIERLAPLSAEERARTSGFDDRRGATIVAGALVLEQVMDGLRIEQIRACDAALREGIVQKALDEMREGGRDTTAGGVRRSSVMALAERSSVDLTHAGHVARLALRIFDQTEELHMLRTGERELLEYAALLHEVGRHVSYQKHHKHSYYLISHAGLRGFTADQVALIANVARYHRKSTPHEDDDNFAQLSGAQQAVVEKLSAILRLADALDRSRHTAIRDVAVELEDEAVSFRMRPRRDAEVEMESALKKAKYFGKVFGRKTRFELAR